MMATAPAIRLCEGCGCRLSRYTTGARCAPCQERDADEPTLRVVEPVATVPAPVATGTIHPSWTRPVPPSKPPAPRRPPPAPRRETSPSPLPSIDGNGEPAHRPLPRDLVEAAALMEETGWQGRRSRLAFLGWLELEGVTPSLDALTRDAAGRFLAWASHRPDVDPDSLVRHSAALRAWGAWLAPQGVYPANPLDEGRGPRGTQPPATLAPGMLADDDPRIAERVAAIKARVVELDGAPRRGQHGAERERLMAELFNLRRSGEVRKVCGLCGHSLEKSPC